MKRLIFGKDSRVEKLLCGIVAVLFPTVIFAYFCARNVNQFSSVSPILLMLTVVIFLAVAAYAVALIIFRGAFPASVFCLVCWTGCYLQPTLRDALNRGTKWSPLLIWVVISLTIIVLAAACAVLLRKVKPKTSIFGLLSAALLIMLIMNVIPLGGAAISAQGRQEDYSQTDFTLDAELSSPNIYWLHPDGMLSVDAVEKYYGDSQDDFLSGLAERGFMYNSGAGFEANHTTRVAVPSLMNPEAYDDWISEYVVWRADTGVYEPIVEIGYRLQNERKHNKLLTAFSQKGYKTCVIASGGYYYPIENSEYYDYVNSSGEVVLWNEKIVESQEMEWTLTNNIRHISGYLDLLFEFLYQRLYAKDNLQEFTEPYVIQMPANGSGVLSYEVESASDESLMAAVYDNLYGRYQSPEITIIQDFTAHFPFRYNEDGSMHEESMDPLAYHAQHVWSGKMLLNMIDMILSVDPDAVIVIQADHGLHGNTKEDFVAAFGEDADAVELWNSTMSAIRVPEQYQNTDLHYALESPLNISRWLVNSFVGQNYEYIE